MDERQTMHAMMLDDAYCVERVLADGAYGVTEMVSLDGAGSFVRKKMPRGGDCGPHTRRMRFVAVPRDDDNGDGVYGSDVAISLILRDEKGNFVFWRSEYVRKPAKGESRAFSIQIYGLPKYASYEAYAYAS